MKINTNKYFEIAKENKISPLELKYSFGKETTVSVFDDKVEEQTIGNSYKLSGKGIINGKLGMYSTDKIDLDTPSVMINNIISSAKFGRDEKKENFFSGGLKYKKAKIYSKDFVDSSLLEMKNEALSLSKEIKKMDSRISKVEVGLAKVEKEDQMYNSLGLAIKEKSRYYQLMFEVICNSDNDTRTSYDYLTSFISIKDLKENAKALISKTVKSALDSLNSTPIKSGKYKAVLSNYVTASLTSFYLSTLNAKSIQKHISIFENKLNDQICSKSITLKHTPHVENTSSSSYDSDGYPTMDFVIVKKGILQNYFYSYETSLVDKVDNNGCGSGLGEASSIVTTFVPSKKSEEDLIKKINNGIYITSVSGLNSGIDEQTLNFSLPCEGYEIKNGKLTRYVSMIVCAGNLKDLFNDINGVANNLSNRMDVISPSVSVKKVAISGGNE